MVIGQHHKLSKKYLELYVNEITYRENVREWTIEDIFIDLIGHCMNCSPNTNFNGYWNRNNTKIKDFRYFEVGNKDYVEISEENNQKEEIPQPNINIGSDKFFSNEFESE